MSALGMLPWARGPFIDLQKFLQESHADRVASRSREIAKRKERGAPMGEVDAKEVSRHAQAIASSVESGDFAAARVSLAAAADGLAGALDELPPHDVQSESHLAVEGIKVRFRLLPEDVRARILGECDEAQEQVSKGRDTASLAVLHKARAEFLALALCHVSGISEFVDDTETPRVFDVSGDTPLPDACMSLLISADVLDVVYWAAVGFQGMPAKKALRFGLPAPSSSTS